MRYARFLEENGKIGFVAPAFGCDTQPYKDAFEHSKEKWEKLGYSLIEGPNCRMGVGIGISNTPQKCGQELNEFFAKEEVDCLISCGGGELMCEDLPFVDFEGIRQNPPKWFMGYSDNTNMTFLLPTICDTAAIYGPCAPAFGMEPWHLALEDAHLLLRGKKSIFTGYGKWEKESKKDAEHPLEPYHVTEPVVYRAFLGEEEWKSVEQLNFKGRLLGGCLDCLANLVGTRFDQVKEFNEKYGADGIIWFLEACDLNVLSIRRALWQLDNAGWFEKAAGFLIGRPLCFGQEIMGMDAYQAVTGILGKYQVPIIMDADLGHLPPMMPLVTGSMANIKLLNNELTVNMRFV